MIRPARRTVLAAGLIAAAPLSAIAAAATKPRVSIQTAKGLIVIELETGKAPLTCANFLRYVDAHRYDGGTFYRASRERGVAGSGTIEGGPNPNTRRFPPIAHESTRQTGLKHRAGTVSLARNAPGTGTGDFFICASPQPYLDAHGGDEGFAAFGQVVQGMDVVRKILALPTTGKTDVVMMKGQIIDPPVTITAMTRTG